MLKEHGEKINDNNPSIKNISLQGRLRIIDDLRLI